MGERESKMGESEKQKVDLSSIKEKQNRKKKKQILSRPTYNLAKSPMYKLIDI